MSNVIVTLLTVALLLNAVALLTSNTIKSADVLTDGWRKMETRSREIAGTKIEVLSATRTGETLEITVKNSGETPLLDFKSWDISVRYQDSSNVHHQLWLPYTAAEEPSSNQWAVKGIYKQATSQAEVFQPNILDPAEEMVIKLRLSPEPKNSVDHLAVIGTSNGVSISTLFT